MNIFRRISSAWNNFFRRRRLSLQNSTDNREEWYTHISPVSIFLAFVSYTTLIFIVVLTLVGYTSILEMLPVYRSDISRSREIMVENILRIDSMELVINDMMLYNDNIALIMDGKSPVVRNSQLMDSVTLNKTMITPSGADSMLRSQMEGEGEYGLRRAAINRSTMQFISPFDGEITQHFNMGADLRSMKFLASGTEPNRVESTDGGVVMLSLWSPDLNYIVQIQHSRGLISIYKNMSQSLVASGDVVKAGEVIGYTQPGNDFEFELWENGKPVNPENYIIF
ncbi:MAG: M23 family metallopeptidase [Rikenellaceae bacterium]